MQLILGLPAKTGNIGILKDCQQIRPFGTTDPVHFSAFNQARENRRRCTAARKWLVRSIIALAVLPLVVVPQLCIILPGLKCVGRVSHKLYVFPKWIGLWFSWSHWVFCNWRRPLSSAYRLPFFAIMGSSFRREGIAQAPFLEFANRDEFFQVQFALPNIDGFSLTNCHITPRMKAGRSADFRSNVPSKFSEICASSQSPDDAGNGCAGQLKMLSARLEPDLRYYLCRLRSTWSPSLVCPL